MSVQVKLAMLMAVTCMLEFTVNIAAIVAPSDGVLNFCGVSFSFGWSTVAFAIVA